MKDSTRLVSWDAIDLRLSGKKIAERIGAEVERMKAPIGSLALQFDNGRLLIEGRIRKAIGIPFTVEIRQIDARGLELRVFLHQASAFGIPLPAFLLGLIRQKLAENDVVYDAATRSFVFRMDRFLPSFVDVDVTEVRLIAGGVAVRLGPGGADPPPPSGGME